MTKLVRNLLMVAVAVSAAGAGVVASQSRNATPASAAPAANTAPLMSLKLLDKVSQKQSLSQYGGQVLVVNFWATWCGPCREEMPEFSAVSQKYASKGVQFVGIGIDSVENIKKFSQEVPVAYPLLAGENDAMQAASALGNRLMALPFTAVLNRRGEVVQTKLGKMSTQELETAVQKALAAG